VTRAAGPQPTAAHDGRTVRIVVLDDHQAAAHRYLPVEELRPWCDPELTVHTDVATSEEELVARLRGAEVVVAMRERSPRCRPASSSASTRPGSS
jgi:hypothetical protein